MSTNSVSVDKTSCWTFTSAVNYKLVGLQWNVDVLVFNAVKFNAFIKL